MCSRPWDCQAQAGLERSPALRGREWAWLAQEQGSAGVPFLKHQTGRPRAIQGSKRPRGGVWSGVSMPRWGEGGESVSSGGVRGEGCAFVGGEEVLSWGGGRAGVVSGCICPAVHPVRSCPARGGVSPAGQLDQRDGGVGAAHAGGAAPAAGAGRGGDAGRGGGAAALAGAAVLEEDVGAQLAPGLARVEQRGAALRVPGGHVGAVLRAEVAGDRAAPGGRPHTARPDSQAHPQGPGEDTGSPCPAVSEREPSRRLYPPPSPHVPTAAAA